MARTCVTPSGDTILRLGRAATGRVLTAAYTVRRRADGERIRIISARRGSRKERAALRQRRRIDFSDIPEASSAQLRAMRRVGRPPLGTEARRLIAIRIDPQVLDAVRREAKRRGVGYQSLINDLLAKHVSRARSA